MPDEILMEKMDVFNRVITEFVKKTSKLQEPTEFFVEICRIFDCIEDSLNDLAKSSFVYCLESCNPQENKIEHNSQTFYFKEVRVKEFLTRYGTIKIKRRVYISQSGESIIPLDEYWQMEGQYAELKIREMIAYLSASNTSAEVETIFKRFLSCTPSRDFIRQTADGIGEHLEDHYQSILEEARQEESIPPDTCVVCVSLDGVNVPLREFGPKHGRPTERPTSETDREVQCSWKNAMVGTITFYGAVPNGKKCPKRLKTVYLSRMPEDRYPTLRSQIESELDWLLPQLPVGVKMVSVNDGARGIASYVGSCKQLAVNRWNLDRYVHAFDTDRQHCPQLRGDGDERWCRSNTLPSCCRQE